MVDHTCNRRDKRVVGLVDLNDEVEEGSQVVANSVME